MSKRLAFWIFIVGTVASAAVFLWATADTHRQIAALAHADNLSDRVVAGKRAFERHNCNDCHTILGFGSYYAPDLTRAVQRVGAEGVRYRVLHPEQAFAASTRKMPRMGVTEQEASELVAFLKWMGKVENGDWPPQESKARLSRATQMTIAAATVSPGAALFKTRGCMGCHSLGGAGGTLGPALDTVGSRRAPADVIRLVKNPQSVNPSAVMPPQDLSDDEIRQVAEFLSGLR